MKTLYTLTILLTSITLYGQKLKKSTVVTVPGGRDILVKTTADDPNMAPKWQIRTGASLLFQNEKISMLLELNPVYRVHNGFWFDAPILSPITPEFDAVVSNANNSLVLTHLEALPQAHIRFYEKKYRGSRPLPVKSYVDRTNEQVRVVADLPIENSISLDADAGLHILRKPVNQGLYAHDGGDAVLETHAATSSFVSLSGGASLRWMQRLEYDADDKPHGLWVSMRLYGQFSYAFMSSYTYYHKSVNGTSLPLTGGQAVTTNPIGFKIGIENTGTARRKNRVATVFGIELGTYPSFVPDGGHQEGFSPVYFEWHMAKSFGPKPKVIDPSKL